VGAVHTAWKIGVNDPLGTYLDLSMSQLERNYSTLEKETLAIIYGVKKFHQFLYGHTFIIKTDHKKRNGIKHIRVAPYHPASNGQAERAVRIFKEGFAKMKSGVQTKLSRFLLSYRTTPHTTTGVPPSQLLMKRKPRVLLNLLQPDIRERVRNKQSQQKTRHDFHARERELPLEEAVYARYFRQKKAWVPGTIIKKSGPVSAEVQLEMVQSSDVIRTTYAAVLIQVKVHRT